MITIPAWSILLFVAVGWLLGAATMRFGTDSIDATEEPVEELQHITIMPEVDDTHYGPARALCPVCKTDCNLYPHQHNDWWARPWCLLCNRVDFEHGHNNGDAKCKRTPVDVRRHVNRQLAVGLRMKIEQILDHAKEAV